MTNITTKIKMNIIQTSDLYKIANMTSLDYDLILKIDNELFLMDDINNIRFIYKF